MKAKAARKMLVKLNVATLKNFFFDLKKKRNFIVHTRRNGFNIIVVYIFK